MTMNRFQAQTVASILRDEGYTALTQNMTRGRTKLVSNAPSYVVASVLSLVGR